MRPAGPGQTALGGLTGCCKNDERWFFKRSDRLGRSDRGGHSFFRKAQKNGPLQELQRAVLTEKHRNYFPTTLYSVPLGSLSVVRMPLRMASSS